jgi:UDP-N-acetylmuramate dehydrogenase
MKHMVEAGEHRFGELVQQLGAEPADMELHVHEPLSAHTRFGIGGPADLLVITRGTGSFIRALELTRASGLPWVVIGGGTNLVVSDTGFHGVVLKFAADAILIGPEGLVLSDAGAVLQDLVDRTIACGLRGLETMTGIPGWVGAAVYGNAGAYGRSISEGISHVSFFDGERVRILDKAACAFRYRESIFKREKNWIILSCLLRLETSDAAQLKSTAEGILRVRNEKYPLTMKCAGSIFKNYLFAELPDRVQEIVPSNVVREGKVPSAWFLEQVGAKGLRVGDIQVATYHANLLYNDGAGTARDLVNVIRQLKQRIEDRFGIPLEEEVQYVGEFPGGH